MNSRLARRPLGRALLLLLVFALGVLSGCAQIPTSGKVGHGKGRVNEPAPVYLQVYGPVTDAGAGQIVQGFIAAQADGSADNWKTAREYLTADTSQSWDPSERTDIYAGEYEVEVVAESDSAVTIEVTIEPLASIDHLGRYTQNFDRGEQAMVFNLSKDDAGQWRINELADGSLVSQPNFNSVYRAIPLYFPTSDESYLVPEVRWYANRGAVSQVTSAILQGPSEWLRDSVEHLVPSGTRLVVNAVSVDRDGIAQVDLTAEVLNMSARERGILLAQLRGSLSEVAGVNDVKLLVNGSDLSLNQDVNLQRDPQASSYPLALSQGKLGRLSGEFLEQLVLFDQVFNEVNAFEVQSLAVNSSFDEVAFVSSDSRLIGVDAANPNGIELDADVDVATLSLDRFGLVWGAKSGTPNHVYAHDFAQQTSTLEVAWLVGRQIVGLKVARDGSRVALLSKNHSGYVLEIAGVIRNEAGSPTKLTQGVVLAKFEATPLDMQWVDELSIGVLQEATITGATGVLLAPVLNIYELGRSVKTLKTVVGAKSFVASRGVNSILILTSEDKVYAPEVNGVSWSELIDEISALALPG